MTTTKTFLDAAFPQKKRAADEMRVGADREPMDYEYLRKIAQGQEPSAAVRRAIAAWGWAHVRTLIDRLFELDPEGWAEQIATARAALAARAEAQGGAEDAPAG